MIDTRVPVTWPWARNLYGEPRAREAVVDFVERRGEATRHEVDILAAETAGVQPNKGRDYVEKLLAPEAGQLVAFTKDGVQMLMIAPSGYTAEEDADVTDSANIEPPAPEPDPPPFAPPTPQPAQKTTQRASEAHETPEPPHDTVPTPDAPVNTPPARSEPCLEPCVVVGECQNVVEGCPFTGMNAHMDGWLDEAVTETAAAIEEAAPPDEQGPPSRPGTQCPHCDQHVSLEGKNGETWLENHIGFQHRQSADVAIEAPNPQSADAAVTKTATAPIRRSGSARRTFELMPTDPGGVMCVNCDERVYQVNADWTCKPCWTGFACAAPYCKGVKPSLHELSEHYERYPQHAADAPKDREGRKTTSALMARVARTNGKHKNGKQVGLEGMPSRPYN